MSSDLTLYDLPSRGRCQCWSGNVWKTRLALNYKSLPYKTHWVPYQDLQNTMQATGVPPNPKPNWSDYSVPALKFPDGRVVMDSEKIAQRLEELRPQPSLHLEAGVHKEVEAALGKIIPPLIPYFMPRVGRDIVLEGDEQWFEDDRAQRFGTSLSELEKSKGGEMAWEAAKPGFATLKEVMRKHKKSEGPFVLGKEPSYGDFMIVAGMKMFSVLGQDAFEKFAGQSTELRELYDACGDWVSKDD